MAMPSLHNELALAVSIAPQLRNGFSLTIVVSAIGIAGAVVAGILGGAVRAYRLPVLNLLVWIYVEAFRETPLLVQIYLLYFALPTLGIRLSGFTVAWLSLALWGGAYMCENFRAGFEAVSRDYRLAGEAVGLTALQIFTSIVMPIGLRIALPSTTNTGISIFKNSSYMTVISFPELTFTAYSIVSQTFRPLLVFAIIGMVYLGVGWLLSLAVRRFEHGLATRWVL